MSDVLANLPPDQVAGFYSRLADQVDMNKGALQTSLAADLMRQWLNNRVRNSLYTFTAPAHLANHSDVKAVLKYHRAVYLTEEKAKFTGGSTKWAGLIPRIQGKAPHQKWNMIGTMNLEYQSLVELPLRYQLTGTDADRDILYALHGFQLKTTVTVTAAPNPITKKVKITFTSFKASVIDTYDWDYTEHLKVPNPDFGSKEPGAIAPDQQTVRVYHSNAKRLEDAGLAAPYRLESTPWQVVDPAITGVAEIDPGRSL